MHSESLRVEFHINFSFSVLARGVPNFSVAQNEFPMAMLRAGMSNLRPALRPTQWRS